MVAAGRREILLKNTGLFQMAAESPFVLNMLALGWLGPMHIYLCFLCHLVDLRGQEPPNIGVSV